MKAYSGIFYQRYRPGAPTMGAFHDNLYKIDEFVDLLRYSQSNNNAYTNEINVLGDQGRFW